MNSTTLVMIEVLNLDQYIKSYYSKVQTTNINLTYTTSMYTHINNHNFYEYTIVKSVKIKDLPLENSLSNPTSQDRGRDNLRDILGSVIFDFSQLETILTTFRNVRSNYASYSQEIVKLRYRLCVYRKSLIFSHPM